MPLKAALRIFDCFATMVLCRFPGAKYVLGAKDTPKGELGMNG